MNQVFLLGGEVKYTECSDEKGTTIASKVLKNNKLIQTLIKTQTGGRMDIATDFNGKRIRQIGDLKFMIDDQSIWKVSIRFYVLYFHSSVNFLALITLLSFLISERISSHSRIECGIFHRYTSFPSSNYENIIIF